MGTRHKCRNFCISSAHRQDYSGFCGQLLEGVKKPSIELAKGEMICVQTNARKTGELFRNMFYLKQVELDEFNFIIGLQAGLPEEFDLDASMEDLERKIRWVVGKLEGNMTVIEHVLAQQFWYSATMRRQ